MLSENLNPSDGRSLWKKKGILDKIEEEIYKCIVDHHYSKNDVITDSISVILELNVCIISWTRIHVDVREI